ncbi:MAG: hypothetical protein WAV20_12715 [Blastocatellia bacterium]
MLRKLLLTLLAFGFPVLPFAATCAADNKLEAVAAYTEAGASDALKKTLDPKGWRVTLADGVFCDIWLRAVLPAGKTEASGAVYTSIGESTLVGVITFAKATTDFRGQSIKPASYSLRYALHPTDGNHMGISPVRDFLVMIPVAMDPNPDAQFKFEELTKMSAKATGTSHPGVLSLVQPASASATPKLENGENGHIVFSATVKNQSGAAIAVAFVLKGHAEQ